MHVYRAQGCIHTRTRCTCVTGFDRTARMRSRSRGSASSAPVSMCECVRESGINPGLLVVCAPPPAVQIQNPTHTTQLILNPRSPSFTLLPPSRPHLASLTRRILCAPSRARSVVYRVYLEVRVRRVLMIFTVRLECRVLSSYRTDSSCSSFYIFSYFIFDEICQQSCQLGRGWGNVIFQLDFTQIYHLPLYQYCSHFYLCCTIWSRYSLSILIIASRA